MDKKHRVGIQAGVELLACGAVFAAVILWETVVSNSEVFPSDLALAGGLGGLCFWLGLQTDRTVSGLEILQPAVLACGLTFLSFSFISFTHLGALLPLGAMAAACSGAALTVERMRRFSWGSRETILIVGATGLSEEVVRELGPSLIGVVDNANGSQSTPGVPVLGDYTKLKEIILQQRPTRILVGAVDWYKHLRPDWLLDYEFRTGAIVEGVSACEDRLFRRIRPENCLLSDLLLAETQRANRRAMAVQAVYSNLTGLFLLFTCAPLLIGFGVLTRLVSGPGPMFARVECAGFQGVPFLHWRFRVRNVRNGRMTAVGSFLTSLGLTNLPQLFNLVRGEMGLFGPAPVRSTFSEYMDRVAPLHAHRLSVKPGLFGWAQANTGWAWAKKHSTNDGLGVAEEQFKMSYDLYYLETEGLFTDISILVRSLRNIHGPSALLGTHGRSQ